MVSMSFGGVPHEITYQGRLTDEAGVPLTGAYDLIFKIYETSGASADLWQEAHGMIPVEDGLFTVDLGSLIPIPDTIFNGAPRYLGIAISGEDEFLPRTQMISVPYAYRSIQSDTAAYAHAGPGGAADGWVDDGPVVRLETDADRVSIGTAAAGDRLVVGTSLGSHNGEMIAVGNPAVDGISGVTAGYDDNNRGWLTWNNEEKYLQLGSKVNGVHYSNGLVFSSGRVGINSSEPTAALDVSGSAHVSDTLLVGTVGQAGVQMRQSSTGIGGVLTVLRNTTDPGILLNGNSFSTGQAALYVLGDDRSAEFDMSLTGNNSVELPSSAIHSLEMANEPGVGNSATKTTVNLDPTFKTIRSRECTFPSSGYVVAIATCQLNTWLDGVNGEEIYLGISGAPATEPGYQYRKTYLSDEPCCQHIETITIHRFFEVSAETKTFFFMGRCVSDFTTVPISDLTIMFFPTAYGSVSPAAEAPGDETEYSQITGGAPMENIIEESVRLQIDNIKKQYDMELAALREANETLIRRLETLEAATDK